MNRRGFLKALAATSLAPFIPSIAASPTLDKAPMADIIAGRVPLFIRLSNEYGVINSIYRKPVNLNEDVVFDEIAECCTVSGAVLETADGSWSLPITFPSRRISMMPGDTLNVMNIRAVWSSNT